MPVGNEHPVKKNDNRGGGRMESQFGDERLARLYRYWWQKRGDGVAPHRSDLNPAEIPDLLPIVHLIDVRWEPLSFRHRLVGTEIVEWLERDVTGKDVTADLYGSHATGLLATLEQLAKEVRPFRRRTRLYWHRRDWLTIETAELPLIDDQGRTAMILRGATFSALTRGFPEQMEFEPLAPPEA